MEKVEIKLSVGKIDASDFAEKVRENWNEGKQVVIGIEEDSHFKEFVKKCGSKLIEKLKGTQKEMGEAFSEQFLQHLPIFPAPIFKSKLFLCLEKIISGGENSSVCIESSFKLIKKMICFGLLSIFRNNHHFAHTKMHGRKQCLSFR